MHTVRDEAHSHTQKVKKKSNSNNKNEPPCGDANRRFNRGDDSVTFASSAAVFPARYQRVAEFLQWWCVRKYTHVYNLALTLNLTHILTMPHTNLDRHNAIKSPNSYSRTPPRSIVDDQK